MVIHAQFGLSNTLVIGGVLVEDFCEDQVNQLGFPRGIQTLTRILGKFLYFTFSFHIFSFVLELSWGKVFITS